MAYFGTAPAPERRNPTGKNRVWDFFRLSNETNPASRRQPAQPRRKIRPTATKSVSGIPYWPSRDPIEEDGGMNLYGFCFNNIFSWFDYLGREAMPVDVTVYPKIKDKPDKPGTPIGNDPAEGNIDKIMKELKEPPYRIPDEMIPVNNLVDANQKLKDLSKKDCCIKTLTFEGHGNSGRQIIGNVNDSTGNWIGMTKDKNGKYVPNGFEVFRGVTFCKPCSIYLRGCNTGKGINERWGTNEPREFATALARATGCNVFGFLTLCYPASGGRTHPPGTYSPEHLGSPSGDPNTNLEELIGRQNPIQNPNK